MVVKTRAGPYAPLFLMIGVASIFLLYFIYNQNTISLQESDYEKSQLLRSFFHKSSLDAKHIPCRNSTPSKSNCITIVTAFFLFSKSKHNPSHYHQWMSNFLTRIDTPMTIFTQPSLVQNITKFREGRPTHFILYNEIWDLPWIKERNLNTTYRKMHEKDPEVSIHSPELYAIWNSKLWMLSHVAEQENAFDSTFFYWMDIGSVRHSNHKLKNFPDVKKAIQVFGENKKSASYSKFNVFAVEKFTKYKSPPDSNTFEEMTRNFIIGGFFGGTIFGVHWFAQKFYSLHDQLLKENYFVGKDQSIYNWMATKYPEHILVVCVCLERNGGCGDTWFYFQQWYSSKSESVGDEGKCQTAPLKNMTDFLLEQRNYYLSSPLYNVIKI